MWTALLHSDACIGMSMGGMSMEGNVKQRERERVRIVTVDGDEMGCG